MAAYISFFCKKPRNPDWTDLTDRMDEAGARMKQEMLTERLIGTFYTLYNDLGNGFLESAYQRGFTLLLLEQGIAFVEQAPDPSRAPWS